MHQSAQRSRDARHVRRARFGLWFENHRLAVSLVVLHLLRVDLPEVGLTARRLADDELADVDCLDCDLFEVALCDCHVSTLGPATDKSESPRRLLSRVDPRRVEDLVEDFWPFRYSFGICRKTPKVRQNLCLTSGFGRCALRVSNPGPRWLSGNEWARTVSNRRPLVCKSSTGRIWRYTRSHSASKCPVQRLFRVRTVQ
jgi:hypothetical protein